MFEINQSRKINKSGNVKSDNNIPQQRAFLNEPQDTLELSTKAKKKSISFRGAIDNVLQVFQKKNDPVISSKAVKMLNSNNIVGEDFEPEKSIASNNPDDLTDMPSVFQRKLAIDIIKGKPNSDEIIYKSSGNPHAEIHYNENGKPDEIKYFGENKHSIKYSEEFEYAHKQDGSPVLVKQNIYKYNDKNEKVSDEEITYRKHHNGVVSIYSTDGRQMSYSLRQETIKNYDNKSKQTQIPIQDTQTTITPTTKDVKAEELQQKELFVMPNPTYPQHEYTEGQKRTINNKFDAIKEEYAKRNNPNDSNAFLFYTPVADSIEQVRNLVLNTKDPLIQDRMMSLLVKMKNYELPTEFVGSYRRLKVDYDDYNEFSQIYQLAKLSALINKDALKVDENGNVTSNLEDALPYTGNKDSEYFSFDEMSYAKTKIDAIMSDNTLTKAERYAEAQKIIHELRVNKLNDTIDTLAYKNHDIKNDLVKTYVRPNIEEKYKKDLDDIEQVIGKTVIPKRYSNFDYDSLENFHTLPDIARKHYLKHPDMCQKIYLTSKSAHGLEKPYDALTSLSEDEWNTFEKRNLANVLDVLTGYNISTLDEKDGKNIHAAIEMPEEKWQKINDFGLFNINMDNNTFSIRKHGDLKFNFDEMQALADNLSYDEWNKAKERELIDAKLDSFGTDISVPIIVSAAKAPESTFRFLKNIGMLENNKLNLSSNNEETFDNVAKGIDFLAKSHNDVYQNVKTLCDNGFSAEDSIELAGISAKNYNRFGKYVTGKILELKDKGVKNHEVRNVLPMYIDFQSIKNKSNINELSIEEKRALLKNVIKYNNQLFGSYAKLLDSPIVPKNKEEYCALLPKLVKSIGIDTRPVSKEVIEKFDKTISDMSDKNSEFLNTKITKDGFKLELEYPRADFIKDVQEKTKDLSDTEKMKVYDYFGFELKYDKDNNIQMQGYPVNINNGAKLAEIDDENTKKVIEDVKPIVEKFSNDNKVTISGKPELSEQINNILEMLPEFRTTIGKEQHGTHDFTVDVHTLKVLQGVMSDERFSQLSEKDKKLLSTATILHDLTKTERCIDKTHPQYSAYDAYHILKKTGMSEADKTKVYQLIKNHEWLAKYNGMVKTGTHTYREKTPQEKDKAAKDIAFELKDGNNFELENILTKADLKAVKETDYFYDKYFDVFKEGTSKIEPLVDNIQKTAIHLPQTKLPKASELVVDGENVQEITTKGSDGKPITNRIVYLKPNMDLGKLGFEKGLNSDDLNVIVHALDYDTQSATFQALGSIDSDSLLSSSYVNYKKGNYHVFRQQGFILDVNSSDIQAGTYKDFGSGYGKDLDTLKSDYLYNGARKSVRNFMSDKVKKYLNISDEEYKRLYPEIADKSVTELDKTHPKVAKAMRDIFMDMDVHRRRYGRDYNEWLVSRPKIQGVFLESSKYKFNYPPEYLAKYAEENDLPIIYFGE